MTITDLITELRKAKEMFGDLTIESRDKTGAICDLREITFVNGSLMNVTHTLMIDA